MPNIFGTQIPWFDKAANYPAPGAEGPMRPRQKGLLSGIGEGLSGVSNAFAIPYGGGDPLYNIKMAQQRQAEEAADFEFQKYLMKDKQTIDPIALALLGQLDPNLAQQYLGITSTAGQTPTLSPTTPPGAPQAGGFVPESIDLGAVNLKNVGFEGQKAVATDKAKEKAGAEKSARSQSRFIQRFSESFGEVQAALPKSGESSVAGLVQRVAAGAGANTGLLPKTQAFLRQAKKLANEQARNVEGGRITDQDRSVYAEAMASAVSAPTETNVRLVADSILDMHDKEANIEPLLNDLISADNELLNSIASEVFRYLPEDVLRRYSGANNTGTGKQGTAKPSK